VKTPEKPETDPNKSNQNSSCDDIDMACQDEVFWHNKFKDYVLGLASTLFPFLWK